VADDAFVDVLADTLAWTGEESACAGAHSVAEPSEAPVALLGGLMVANDALGNDSQASQAQAQPALSGDSGEGIGLHGQNVASSVPVDAAVLDQPEAPSGPFSGSGGSPKSLVMEAFLTGRSEGDPVEAERLETERLVEAERLQMERLLVLESAEVERLAVEQREMERAEERDEARAEPERDELAQPKADNRDSKPPHAECLEREHLKAERPETPVEHYQPPRTEERPEIERPEVERSRAECTGSLRDALAQACEAERCEDKGFEGYQCLDETAEGGCHVAERTEAAEAEAVSSPSVGAQVVEASSAPPSVAPPPRAEDAVAAILQVGVKGGDATATISSSPEVSAPAPKALARAASPRRAGHVRVGDFEVKEGQLPAGKLSTDVEAAMQAARAEITGLDGQPKQVALRLVMGCDLDIDVARGKYCDVVEWRSKHRMEEVREGLTCFIKMPGKSSLSPFPHTDEMCKLMVVNPCAVLTTEGWPVSVWHIGTIDSKVVAHIAPSKLETWSAYAFEYVDVWLAMMTERVGVMAGHTQVFDLDGMSMWHVTNTALIELLQKAFSAANNYVESVSHIYVINSGAVFSMVWQVVKNLITRRTEAKITVSPTVPPELLERLGPKSAEQLLAVLQAKRPSLPLLRPVFLN
jgi:hypothetical protein